MKDRFLFRAWVKDVCLFNENGDEYKKSFMIYDIAVFGGCSVGLYGNDIKYKLELQGFSEDEIKQFKDDWCSEEGVDWFNFDADEIEQCTGLKDKNDKLIYEGDILNSLYRRDGCRGLYVVEWFDGNLGVKKVGEHQQKMVSVSLSDLTRCEVIGNIHENPELLK